MSESFKDMAKRYVEQQQEVFGDALITARPARPSARAPVSLTRPSGGAEIGEVLSSIDEDWTGASTLEELDRMINTCQRCPLGATRTKFVFGVGNPAARIMVIGEAPGADEDRQGEPFVGAAGQLLNKILAAVDLRREDVFIANILKSRPPGNRTPERAEVDACLPYLLKQLDLIRPRLILALGLTAASTLLNTKARMSELRGRVHEFHGIRVVVTYHPAALLRNPQWKRSTWEDVQMLKRLHDEEEG